MASRERPISRIAKGAGITSAALYSHFENRQAILLAALDVVYEQVFDSFRSSTSNDPVQRLREICENHAEKVRNQDKTSHAHLFLEFVASAPEEGCARRCARRSSPPPPIWPRSSRSSRQKAASPATWTRS